MKQYLKNIKQSFKLKKSLNYFVIAVFLIAMIGLDAGGMLGRSTVGILSRIAYCIILAVSLNLVVGFLGELSLGHAGFMCVGAYVGCFCANLLHKSIASDLLVLIIAMLIGGATAAVFGFIVGLPALRLRGDYLAIVTLAFGEIVRNIFNGWDAFGGAMGLSTKPYDAHSLFIVAFIVVLFVLMVCQNLIRSKHGRAITAIRDNEIAAKAMGINVTYYKLFVFTIAAFFAGVAGVIYGHSVSIIRQDYFTYNYSIDYLVMVVLGGMGSMNGSIIAASLITYINVWLQNMLTGDLAGIKQPIYALILIAVVMFNNAPALKPFKERFNLRNLWDLIFRSRRKPEVIKDDAAEWNRIETKIKIDDLLSVEVPPNKANTPDKPQKDGAAAKPKKGGK